MASDAVADPAMAHAQTQAPNKRQDDFDMAKLKKSLKQEQKRSLVSKHKVAKLTPDEIRSLNHSAGVSKANSVRSFDNQSDYRLSSNTPPLTPDNQATSQQPHLLRLNKELPTPPVSPDRERRGSNSSTRHIHAPRPVSHGQAVHLTNASAHQRPPSASSYRGIATYRGPEITRTGSLTMLQRPSQQIVSNPLSQFSRPRQSTLTSSPQKNSSELRAEEDFVSPASIKDRRMSSSEGMVSPVATRQRHQSLGALSTGPSRDHSPIRPSDSPVSIEDGKVPELAYASTNEDVAVVQGTPNGGPNDKKDELAAPSTKSKASWRRTLTGSSESTTDPTPLRKEHRRRSLMSPTQGYCLHAIRYDDTKAGKAPQLRDSLKDELPSAKSAEYKGDANKEAMAETEYGQHPAVRPLSTDAERLVDPVSDSSPSSSRKGKEREVDTVPDAYSDAMSMTSSVPSYSRCSCCGRIQKPGGFESELSPVMENENLRTNFTFEVEKTDPNRERRSSSLSSNRGKYVPIIPMEVGNETKQARIEPMKEKTASVVRSIAPPPPKLPGVAINKRGDVIAPGSTPLAIMPRAKVDPKMVRFASLHMKKEEKEEEEEEQQKQMQARNLAPPQRLPRFVSLYGLRNEAQQQSQAMPQDQGYNQDQTLHQAQQQPQSAYQAQQARQYPIPNGNSYQPVRSSRLAYQYQDDASARSVAQTNSYIPPEFMGIAEKPLGDSPASSRNNSRRTSSPRDSLQEDQGEPVVDLSSFDGSFVQNSLSRSATVMRNSSPPTVNNESNGIGIAISKNGNEPNIGRTIVPASNGDSDLGGQPLKSSTPSQSSDGSTPTAPYFYNAITTSTVTTTNPDSNEHDPRSIPSSMTDSPAPLDTNLGNATVATLQKPTTVVRIIPSAPVSHSSSPATTPGGKNAQLKLGDWVLPESPSDGTGSMSSGKRTVAAA